MQRKELKRRINETKQSIRFLQKYFEKGHTPASVNYQSKIRQKMLKRKRELKRLEAKLQKLDQKSFANLGFFSNEKNFRFKIREKQKRKNLKQTKLA